MDVSGVPRRALTGMPRLVAAARRAHRAAPSPVPFLWSTLVATVIVLTAGPTSPPGTMQFDNGHGGSLELRMSQPLAP